MISPLFKKLNYKAQEVVCILNAPHEFEPELRAIEGQVKVVYQLDASCPLTFFLAFVQSPEEVEALATTVAQQLEGDGIVWFAYPKKSSKKYKASINRDAGWESLGNEGFEPVRAVAIDQDWSVMRFRKVDYIKTMTRNPHMILSKAGKAKSQSGKK
ncbi:MAG: hypothetical protein ACFB10_11545 [Salibacteraceae bacterium]